MRPPEERSKECIEKDLRRGKRIDAVGWALFFIMIGGLWMMPPESVPEGTWLIGAGLIMFGMNIFRAIFHLPIVALTIFLGIVALALGLAEFFIIDIPVFPVLLILVGFAIIFKLLYPATRS